MVINCLLIWYKRTEKQNKTIKKKLKILRSKSVDQPYQKRSSIKKKYNLTNVSDGPYAPELI